ncbi:DUF4111 domain-containing protein [Nocardia colli]|uniref:DUF4111 domain-containing protein n=1 Tax=Nocardia colli TaxID=2545717 RepID=UPI0035D90BE6
MGDSVVVGPPPAEVLASVPVVDLTHAMVAGVPGLLGELESDTRNVLLTLARIWMTVTTGEIAAKDRAAEWAVARVPESLRAPLVHARAVYLGAVEEDWAGAFRETAAVLWDAIDASGG